LSQLSRYERRRGQRGICRIAKTPVSERPGGELHLHLFIIPVRGPRKIPAAEANPSEYYPADLAHVRGGNFLTQAPIVYCRALLSD